MTRDEEKAFNGIKLAARDRIRRDRALSAATRTVGEELISRVNSIDGGVKPTDQAWLAEQLGYDVKTIKRAIAKLVEVGYLEKRKTWKENRYRAVLVPREAVDQGTNCPLTEDAQGTICPPENDSQGAIFPSQGTKTDPIRGQKRAGSTSFENPLSLSLPAGARDGATPDGAAAPASSLPAGFAGALEARIGENAFKGRFADGKTAVVSEIGSTLTLAASSAYIASQVKGFYADQVLDVWRQANPAIVRLEVIVVPQATPAKSVASRVVAPPAAAFGRRKIVGTAEDASWLDHAGLALVSARTGKAEKRAKSAIWEWLERCGNDASGLRQILEDAAAQDFDGDRFVAVVKERTRRLLFKQQQPLPLKPMSIERKVS